MAKSPIKVAVYGATGYTAAELLRLLHQHPKVEVAWVVSHSQPHVSLADLHPQLIGSPLAQLTTIPTTDTAWQACDCVFFATPALIAMKQAPPVLDKGGLVIDLSPDFRIKDLAVWQHWYKARHQSPALVDQAVYGLSEAHRSAIARARLIANPGCYATAVQLALLPLLANYGKQLSNSGELVVDAKSGFSGAGKMVNEAGLLTEAEEDFTCYAATGHRHQAEMEECLSELNGAAIKFRFVPHLVPMSRGLFADLYLPLGNEREETLRACYQDYYHNQPFVQLLPAGHSPHTKAVRGTNQCHIAIFTPPKSDYIHVSSALDNLGKGAAGQAIQNMNIALGMNETDGLEAMGLSP